MNDELEFWADSNWDQGGLVPNCLPKSPVELQTFPSLPCFSALNFKGHGELLAFLSLWPPGPPWAPGTQVLAELLPEGYTRRLERGWDTADRRAGKGIWRV